MSDHKENVWTLEKIGELTCLLGSLIRLHYTRFRNWMTVFDLGTIEDRQ